MRNLLLVLAVLLSSCGPTIPTIPTVDEIAQGILAEMPEIDCPDPMPVIQAYLDKQNPCLFQQTSFGFVVSCNDGTGLYCAVMDTRNPREVTCMTLSELDEQLN